MGLFGGGNSRSSTSNTTNNYDQSQTVGSGELYQLEGSILADEVGNVSTDSFNKTGSENASVIGDGTINMFGDNAARVVQGALDLVGNTTAQNLRAATGQTLEPTALSSNADSPVESLKAAVSSPFGIVALGAAGIFIFMYFKKKAR